MFGRKVWISTDSGVSASLLGHGLLRWKLLIMRVGWDAKLGGIEISKSTGFWKAVFG